MENKSDRYRHYKRCPPEAYSAAISHFYLAINQSESAVEKILSPSFLTLLIFNLGEGKLEVQSGNETLEIKKWMILGPLKKAINYTVPPQGRFFVVNFKDDFFHRFFRQVLTGTSPETSVHVNDTNCFDPIWRQLKARHHLADYSDYITACCRNCFGEDDPVIRNIMAFKNDGATSSIKQVAKEKSISIRAVQKKHKKHFGYSAKEISRYRRFSETLHFLEKQVANQEAIDWFAIIARFGYYDQSQLIHEFNHYLHCTPGKYVSLQKDICIIKTN